MHRTSAQAQPFAEEPLAQRATHATWRNDTLYLWIAAAPRSERQAIASAPSNHLQLRLPGEESAVEARPLSGRKMLELLEALPSSSGDSVHCFARLLNFVKGAVAREQFYPSAHRIDGQVIASWRLLITSERDVERLEAFAAAMPGACFAADPPRSDRLESVESFLNACCDGVVRRSLANDEFFANMHEMASEPSADAEVRWISALISEDAARREVRGRIGDVAELLEKVQTWTARLGDAGGEPWRLGFVLDEPMGTASPARSEQKPLSSEPATSHVHQSSAPDRDASSPRGLDEGEAVPLEETWPLRLRLLPPPDLEDTHVPLPARQVWTQPAGSIGFIGRNAARLRERLGSELARAAESAPPVRRILEIAQPEQLDLTTAEAFRFIRDWAETLREHGFDVQLPPWAGSRESRVEVVMDLRPADGALGSEGNLDVFEPSPSHLGLDSLLAFDWKVALGGEAMSAEEFRALVAEQRPLIRRDGRWIEIDPEAAAAAAQLMASRPPGTLTLGEAFRAGFGLGRGISTSAAAPAVRLEGTRWIERLLEQSPDSKAREIPQPPSFVGALRPYQLRGLQWLAFLDRIGLGGILADDMGLGKTIELIALLLHEKESWPASLPRHPTLLFVPTSVLGNWQREIHRFGPALKTMLHHGPQRLKGGAFREATEGVDVVITSYALSHRDQEDLRAVTWGRVALDEAQKIKNPSAASSVAVRSIEAPRKVALTGTPVENHLGELWSIMDMLNAGLLGSLAEFREKFAIPIEKGGDRGRARRLREMIRPFVLRRTKDDPGIIGDLPAKMEMNVYCGLTAEQAAMYERITAEMLGRIDTATGIRRRGLILSVLTKLKQVCDHPALVADEVPRALNRSGKAQRLAEMLEEVIEEGEKALVFTQYRQMGDILLEMLEKKLGRRVLFMHGGTPQPKRDEMVMEFQSGTVLDTPPVFILSLRAGGLGLNLTAASHVFHYDRWWNPAVENQATDRAHRIGQVRRVQVHKYVSIGTVEERIDKMLQEKSQLAANIVGSGDEWLTELSTTELRDYLSLTREAIADAEEEGDDE
jgi:SNF2 family DNA or RNA helicase